MSLNSLPSTRDFSSSRPFANPKSPVGTRRELLQQISQMDISGDQDEPIKIEYDDISSAAFRIRGSVVKTPCEKSHIPDLASMEVYFKKEFLQHTGSFKERGALNTLQLLSQEAHIVNGNVNRGTIQVLDEKEYAICDNTESICAHEGSKEQQNRGIVAASAGNHALALAYHGCSLDIPVTVIMPENAPLVKISLCKKFGATVKTRGHNIADARAYALKLASEKGLAYINGYDHPYILAGAGTVGLEIIDQVPDIDAIIVPTGGAGLLAGIANAVKPLFPEIKVIAVESEECPSFKAAMDAGKPVKIDAQASMTIADGLCVPRVGKNAFLNAKNLVDKVVTVSEDFIGLAVLRLVETEKAVVEGAGATGLAALLAGLLPELNGKRVVVPLCGGNIDPTVLGRCIDRGLAADGRMVRFVVTISDRPGGMAKITSLIASTGASIKDIFHERAWLKSSIFSLQCKVVAEVRDKEHGKMLKELLESKYEEVFWNTDHATAYDHHTAHSN